MGDVGARRSTLVSRLPIFRRSSSKRRDSLPSSPSSATNGVHTSSPSSTNSSSSSVGKRRSIFRTPSIGFHSKKSQEHRLEPRDPNAILPNGVQAPDGAGRKDNVNENPKTKSRHSFGLSVPRSKRITRSATEDFEKGKDLSHNKNVFMNCISSGRSSMDEGDDSGFPDDSKRTIKQSSRKLLPKSFSTHHKLSKHIARSQSIATAEQPKVSPEVTVDSLRRPVIEEPSKYLQVDNPEGSLHSPLLSSDNTTILTPSEFVPMSADSVSEADKEILVSADPDRGNGQFDAAVAAAAPTTVNAPSLAARVLTYAECSVEKETALLSDVFALETHPYRPQVALRGQGSPLMVGRLETKDVVPREPQADLTAEEVASVAHDLSSPQSGPETMNPSIGKTCMLASTNSVSMMKPQEQSQGTSHSTVTMNRTFSPRHEDKWAERRLRSSSEGTSGSRRNHGVRDGRPEDLPCLTKQRADSSSSKMNSMDVLNRLGSCDLDEDDLMLDLECVEDLHHQCESAAAKRFVCREDSNHSIKSCLEILHVPPELKMKLEGPKLPEAANESLCIKEGEHGEIRPAHNNHWLGGSPSDCTLLREEETAGGLDPLSLRLLMQDCTAVRTMLLKLKRILQESAEMSPASSTHSLPVSPNIEMPFACKDPKDESALLRLQLREKDELIAQLREELDSHRSLQKTLTSQADKSTQTEILSHEASYLIRTVNQPLITRDRRLAPLRTEDPCKYSVPTQAAACEIKPCQLSSTYTGQHPKLPEAGRGFKSLNGGGENPSSELLQNIQSNGSCRSSMQGNVKAAGNVEEVSELARNWKDKAPVPRQQSVFVGRLGQPPRGPLSLHMYSRKNVFLQHSLHTSDLQALGQKEG
ncbi:serine-rich coiled-coil domain-containing protein 1 isoform X1 [Leucoraja erinacea]|uniref:serine-rich coiled-coil domain-containing protein 1 isoform X1 n=1 Tax=Leucoraja erinaceus TaxID=7782 RepID=UPI002453958C|nr:serine-rich coiled-coil domain-containing protein 1 isoform X1 [Leucoraja erinacea]